MFLCPLFLVIRSDQARRGVICQDVVYIRLGVAAQQLRVARNHWVAEPWRLATVVLKLLAALAAAGRGHARLRNVAIFRNITQSATGA